MSDILSNLVNQHYSKGVGNYIVYKSNLTPVFCLQMTKRNEHAPHSDAFLGQRLLSLTLHGRSNAINCAITTVQIP